MEKTITRRLILLRSLIIFALSGALCYVSIHVFIPALMGIGWGVGEAYLLCWSTPLFLLFVTALVLYKMEGNAWTWKDFAARFRLNKFDKKATFWTIGLLIFVFIGAIVLSQTLGRFLSNNFKFFAAPDFLPAGLHPNKLPVKGELFGMPLKGQWWILIVYVIGWFFNIAGEELLFRGFLLPKEEEALGKHAWIFQGVLWALWHAMWVWYIIPYLFAVTLPLLFVVSKFKNTWIGIIVHGAMNFSAIVLIIIGLLQ